MIAGAYARLTFQALSTDREAQPSARSRQEGSLAAKQGSMPRRASKSLQSGILLTFISHTSNSNVCVYLFVSRFSRVVVDRLLAHSLTTKKTHIEFTQYAHMEI